MRQPGKQGEGGWSASAMHGGGTAQLQFNDTVAAVESSKSRRRHDGFRPHRGTLRVHFRFRLVPGPGAWLGTTYPLLGSCARSIQVVGAWRAPTMLGLGNSCATIPRLGVPVVCCGRRGGRGRAVSQHWPQCSEPQCQRPDCGGPQCQSWDSGAPTFSIWENGSHPESETWDSAL